MLSIVLYSIMALLRTNPTVDIKGFEDITVRALDGHYVVLVTTASLNFWLPQKMFPLYNYCKIFT